MGTILICFIAFLGVCALGGLLQGFLKTFPKLVSVITVLVGLVMFFIFNWFVGLIAAFITWMITDGLKEYGTWECPYCGCWDTEYSDTRPSDYSQYVQDHWWKCNKCGKKFVTTSDSSDLLDL